MLQNDQLKTSSERLEELAQRLEQSEMFDIEGAKFDISEHVFSMMERQGMSKAALARSLGKSRAYITKILQGNANFTLESLVKIARALDCRLDMSRVLVPTHQVVPMFDWRLANRQRILPRHSQAAECEYIRLVTKPKLGKETNPNAPFVTAA